MTEHRMIVLSNASSAGSWFPQGDDGVKPNEVPQMFFDRTGRENAGSDIETALKKKDLELRELQVQQLKQTIEGSGGTTMSTTGIIITTVIVSLIVVKWLAPKCTWANFFRAAWRLIIKPGRAEAAKIKKEWEDASKD